MFQNSILFSLDLVENSSFNVLILYCYDRSQYLYYNLNDVGTHTFFDFRKIKYDRENVISNLEKKCVPMEN